MMKRSTSRKKSKEPVTATPSLRSQLNTSQPRTTTTTTQSNKSKKQQPTTAIQQFNQQYNQPLISDIKKSRQPLPMISDLYKTQTQHRAEINDLMREIDMPDEDESLTVSSMSQSPFQLSRGNTARQSQQPSHQMTQKNPLTHKIHNALKQAYEPDNELTTLGRSDQFEENQGTGSLKMLMFGNSTTRGGQNTMSSHMLDNESESEESKIDQVKPTAVLSRPDSPDFNRRYQRGLQQQQLDEEDSAYDLTVSHNGNQNGLTPLSYRANNNIDLSGMSGGQVILANNQSKTQTSTNRTFADSVMNHQYNQYTSSSNNNTHRQGGYVNEDEDDDEDEEQQYGHRRKVLRKRRNEDSEHSSISEQEEEEEDGMLGEEESKMLDDEDIDPSELSAIDAFAQTQYSKYSKYYSKLGHSRFGGARNVQNITDKSPQIIRKQADDESMSLTPSTNDGKWQLTQKSYLTANNVSSLSGNPLIRDQSVMGTNTPVQLHSKKETDSAVSGQTITKETSDFLFAVGNNRTTTSDNNLLNRLTTNIPQVLNTNRTTMEQPAAILNRNHHHNRSLQRDPELEKALEEETLKRATFEEDSGSEQQPKNVGLNFKISKLSIQVKTLESQRDRLTNDLDQKDIDLQNLHSHLLSLQHDLEDKTEHINLLQQKFKDDSLLPRLRQKHLDLARRQVQQMQQELVAKDQECRKLEQDVRERECEDKALYQAQKEEIQRLHQEMDTLQVLMKSKERQQGEIEKEVTRKMQLSEDGFHAKINELQSMLDSMRKSHKEAGLKERNLEADLALHKNQMQELHNILDQKDKSHHSLEKELSKMSTELKGFKDRCKFLESELEQTKSFEVSNFNQQAKNKNEYEMKQIKDVYDKKLNKVNEELSKKIVLIKDLEVEQLRLREEAKKYISSTSEKYDRDQELMNELSRLRNDNQTMRQLEQDIKYCFNLEESTDLITFLTRVSQDLETLPLLEKELEKMCNRLEDTQRQLIERESALNSTNGLMNSSQTIGVKGGSQQEGMSNFLRTMLLEKDRQIEQLRAKYESLDDTKTDMHSEQMKLEAQLKNIKQVNIELSSQVEQMQQETIRQKEGKDRAEKNVDELKEKLRVLIREQQDDRQQLQSKQSIVTSQLALQEDPRLKELINQVLTLNLVSDPISQIGDLLLQDSFNDDFEHAFKHLALQESLVKATLLQLSQENNQLTVQLSNTDTLKSDILKAQQSLKDKDRQLEIASFEVSALKDSCERQLKEQKEVESLNIKLRSENEQANLNLRKALRAQENANGNGSSQKVNIERIQMSYEDQISISEVQIRKTVQKEVLNTLDQILNGSNEVRDKFEQEMLAIIENIKGNNHQQFEEAQFLEHSIVRVRPSTLTQQNSNHPHITKNFGFNQPVTKQQNDDNSMLLLSDMLDHDNHENYDDLQTIIIDLEVKLRQAQEALENAKITNDMLNEEVRLKDRQVKETELTYTQRVMDIEEQARDKNQQMWKEVESLKDQIKSELTLKSQKLDQEFEDLQSQKTKLKEENIKHQKEQDFKHSERMQALDKEFISKLQQVEKQLRTSSEQSKEATIASLYQQLQDQHTQHLKTLQEEHLSNIALMKQDSNLKLEELRRVKDREIKKLKEDSEKKVKTLEDKLKKASEEQSAEIEILERDHREKLDIADKKGKTLLKQGIEKAKAEGRNQVDAVRNEMVKAKAEQEREKKRMLQEAQNQVEMAMREAEEKQEVDMKTLREKIEKLHKKKLEDREREHLSKVETLEAEAIILRELHKEELRKERERAESRLRDQVRIDVKQELHDQFEEDYKTQLDKLRATHSLEIEKLKLKYRDELDRVEKACQLPTTPRKQTVDTRSTFVQCEILENSLLLDENNNCDSQDNTGLVVINQSSIYGGGNDIIEYSRQQPLPRVQEVNQFDIQNIKNEHSRYVEQLKSNYEDEMERQQQVFEVQLVSKQQSAVRVFEELMTLEFDKILQSIYSKQQQMQSNNKLEAKRREVNNLISEILARNDDRQERQMKNSLETLKRKFSEVLRVFKGELENKYNRKLQILQQEHQEQIIRSSRDVSDIVSNSYRGREEESFYSTQDQQRQIMGGQTNNQSEIVYDEEDLTSPVIGGVANHIQNFTRGLEAQQPIAQGVKDFSDIKNYVSEDECDSQILRRITPMPNSKGVLVVEVDKVLRDLKMLYKTIKQAKFYRLLIESDENIDIQSSEVQITLDSEEQHGSNHEASLQEYRLILNSLIKLVVTLNSQAEQATKSNELYRVKLQNADLRQECQILQGHIETQQIARQAEDILSYYESNALPYEMLSKEAQNCLSLLENTQSQISQQTFKLLQLKDLFISTNGKLNRHLAEVNRLCSEFNKTHTLDMQSQDNNVLLQSQGMQSPSKMKTLMMAPEMLSPEETAQLIANVFQKINLGGTNTTYNSTCNSFFQTFLSNEDNIRSADNFIQKYREQLLGYTGQQNVQYKNRNMPLQVTQRSHDNLLSTATTSNHQQRNNNFFIVDQNDQQECSQFREERSRSQNSNHSNGSSNYARGSAHPQNNKMVTNVFTQQNMMPLDGQYHSQSQKSLVTHFISQQQQQYNHNQSIQQHPFQMKQNINSSIGNTTQQSSASKAKHPYQSIQLKVGKVSQKVLNTATTNAHTVSTGSLFQQKRENNNNQNFNSLNYQGSTQSIDELSSVQSNVNQMFDKIRGNYSTQSNGSQRYK